MSESRQTMMQVQRSSDSLDQAATAASTTINAESGMAPLFSTVQRRRCGSLLLLQFGLCTSSTLHSFRGDPLGRPAHRLLVHIKLT